MYIYLDDDLVSLDFELNPKFIDKLRFLIASATYGCNLLNAKRSTFKFLISSKFLSPEDKIKLEQIQRFNFEYQDFFDQLNYKIIVTNNTASIYKDEHSNTWYFPLEKMEYGFLDSIELLAEDLSDGELLLHAVDHYVKLNSLRKLSFKITPRNGGGANIARNFRKFLEPQSNFVVAFCDSDRFSPKAHFSETTKLCESIANERESFGYFLHTHGREIENDIPLVFIEEGHREHSLVMKNIGEVNGLKEKLPSPFFKYVDLKEGLKPEWISGLGTGSDCKLFWETVVNEIDALGAEFISRNKSEARANQNLIISQICSSLANNVLAWLMHEAKNHPKSPHLQLVNQNDSENWLDHGKKLFEFGCAMPKVRL